jgi:hypothetical protein
LRSLRSPPLARPPSLRYFWETGNDNVNFRTKVWHRSVQFLGKALYVAEYCGEVVAHMLGINESRYQYVMDNMTEEDWERARKVNDVREKEWADLRASQAASKDAGVTPDAL